MIQMPIPKEIRKYETKLLGPLTSRQLICLLCGVALSAGLMFVMKNYVGLDLGEHALTLCLPGMGICMAFTLKPCGMKFEDYALNYIYDNFIHAAKRKYTSENYYQKISKPYKEIVLDKKGKPVKAKVQKKKKVKSKYKYIV